MTEVIKLNAQAELYKRNAQLFRSVFNQAFRLRRDHFRTDVEGVSPHISFIYQTVLPTLEESYFASVDGRALSESARQRKNIPETRKQLNAAHKQQTLSLIATSALFKANRTPDGSIFDPDAQSEAQTVRNLLLSDPIKPEELVPLYLLFEQIEDRGFKTIPKGSHDLFIVNGADWCPDTKDVVVIANLFQIPCSVIFMNEENKTRKSFWQYEDHAAVILQPNPSKPRVRIPEVSFSNGSYLNEPTSFTFIAALAQQGYL